MKTVLQKKKILMPLLLAAAMVGNPYQAHAQKNVMCLKTNTGKYIELCRVRFMAVVDGGATFDIIVKDGEGARGVSSVSFEKHASTIDLSQYSTSSDGTDYVDLNLPVWLRTSTGKDHKLSTVSALANIDGKIFEVLGSGFTESNVQYVTFYRSKTAYVPQEGATGIDAAKSGDTEQLQLLTPVHTQLSLSYCGDAKKAVLYSSSGKQVGGAAVNDGETTIYVGNLPAGVYIVKVGNKALKFTKQ